MPTIQKLTAREILDSRGRPTVQARCVLQGGAVGEASVPSGASTGVGEALELRDGDPKRYRGMGCLKAAANVNGPIADALLRRGLRDQADLDHVLIELDGTANKSKLGANAILAVSIAFARAWTRQGGIPLYRHFADILARVMRSKGRAASTATGEPERRLPRLTINLFSGGKHAGQQVAIQDCLAVPVSPTTIDGQLVMMHEVYQEAAKLIRDRFDMRLLTADEGGLAPPLRSSLEMLELAMEAIESAGLEPGADVALALDVAASHFYEHGAYQLDGQTLDAEAMIGRLAEWRRRFPIVSIEDGLAETDWDNWPKLRDALSPDNCNAAAAAGAHPHADAHAASGSRCLALGDDLLCTNPKLIQRAIDARACDALLLKVNQIGTLTEAAEAYRLARSAGWRVTISVRSGETEDDWAADLAVGWAGDQFKNGSITQSERLAKYNRLLAIEAETRWPVNPWPKGD